MFAGREAGRCRLLAAAGPLHPGSGVACLACLLLASCVMPGCCSSMPAIPLHFSLQIPSFCLRVWYMYESITRRKHAPASGLPRTLSLGLPVTKRTPSCLVDGESFSCRPKQTLFHVHAAVSSTGSLPSHRVSTVLKDLQTTVVPATGELLVHPGLSPGLPSTVGDFTRPG
jgi:hypothetical protein